MFFVDDGAEVSMKDVRISCGIILHLSFMLVRGFCEAVWETEFDEMSTVMKVNFHI
jgi:hypothetical protein